MLIAAFSTDWTSEPVPDELKSALTGRPEVVAGKTVMTYGGTFYSRGAMPLLEMDRNTEHTVFLTWRFRVTDDGVIEAMDTQGEWHTPDVFWTQRWMDKDGSDLFRNARAAGQIIISDLDDDFWGLTKTNVAYDTTDPKNNPGFNRDHYWNNLAASSAIICSTDPLRKRVEKLGVPTFVVRNVVDIDRWPQLDPTSNGMVGWVGGIQWRAHDMQVLKPAVRNFLEDYGLPFYHGGDSQVAGVPKAWDMLGLDKERTAITSQPLCHISEYPKLWEPINIALVPLEVCAFNQAKSYLKSLEASACGLPYIVSGGLAEQRILIDEGGAGRLADNRKPMSWYDHLTDLLDPEVRALEGKQNRAVAELHDVKTRWIDWANVLEEIATT